jgi:2',3'-cyclic-nucleotide 2'-phosphodiesterase (5'-nucleotidase family)
MNRKTTLLALLATLFLASACRSHYEVAGIQRSRIVIDSRYDANPDAQAAEFLKPYKHVVDSIMGPVVGESARYMTAERPEGTLSNLLSDIMVWAAKDYNETVDFGVYNMGGVRADLPKGKITYGDVLDIAPFENKIAFTTLSGEAVTELFQQMASVGGEGVSRGCELVISADGELLSARLNGEEIDSKADYRITTIDYLLGGNDGMDAFKDGRDVNSPQEARNNTRFIIMNYFKQKAAKGEMVDAQVEGRIRIKR